MQRKAVMLGLGRLQLGLIGPILSDLGYQLTAINLGDENVAKRIKNLGYYRVIDEPPTGGYDIEVAEAFHCGVSPPSGEIKNAIESAATAELINCALGTSPGAIDAAVAFLLSIERFRRERAIVSPLFVTASDNPLGGQFAVDVIREALQSRVFSLDLDESCALANDMAFHWFFPETISDRICSRRIVPENTLRPVAVIVEPYKELVCSRLFLSLKPLIDRNASTIGEIVIKESLELSRQRKIFMLNLAHSVVAYISNFESSRPRTIAQGLALSRVRNYTERALEQVAKAMCAREGGSLSDWYQYAGNVMSRISSMSLEDPIERITTDTKRKLSYNDRLIGPLVLVARETFVQSDPIMTTIAHALALARLGVRSSVRFSIDAESRTLGEELEADDSVLKIHEITGLRITDPLERAMIAEIYNKYIALVDANTIE